MYMLKTAGMFVYTVAVTSFLRRLAKTLARILWTTLLVILACLLM